MARYIDADKLVEMYERSIKEEWNKKTAPSSWADAYDCVIADIDDAPAADVAPRADVDKLEYTLIGVMHCVDKWLDGDELKQDEVNRAITMREKTLRIVENARAEVAREIFDEIEREITDALKSNYKVLPQIEESEALWYQDPLLQAQRTSYTPSSRQRKRRI